MACGGGPSTDAHQLAAQEAAALRAQQAAPAGNEPVDAFFDPRGFARQRAQNKAKARTQAAKDDETPPTVN
jgi:hypothetical protein